MTVPKILFIAPELPPFLSTSAIALEVSNNIKSTQDIGCEVRVLMPRFGLINERRHRLHEVIRLSGKNIPVRDHDYLMIVKVASLPGMKIQTYFIDNDDLFHRKYAYVDAKKQFFADNDERLAFFSKGAISMINQVGWIPDIIHCHGWFSSIIALYVNALRKNPDSVFSSTKIVYSAYNVEPNYKLGPNFGQTIAFETIPDSVLYQCRDAHINSLQFTAANNADGVVLVDDIVDEDLKRKLDNIQVPLRHVGTIGASNVHITSFYEQFFANTSAANTL